jgi:uncharacterized membrane protein (UPF0182 family)
LAAATFLWLWANFRLARSMQNLPRPIYLESWADFPRRHRLLSQWDRVLPLLWLLIAFLLGVTWSEGWSELLLFRHAGLFGSRDPVFEKDLGFYVFQLPFFQSLYRFAGILLAGAFGVIGIYLLQHDIQPMEKKVLVTRPALVHLAFLGACFFFWQAAGYQLDRYRLLYSPEGVVFGATYTDLSARLPALRLLQVAATAAGLTLLVGAFLKRPRAWIFPALTGGIWIGIWVFGLIVYPNFVQRFRVTPNEIALETPYIQRNIEFTRRAYGLTSLIEQPFPVAGDLREPDLRQNRATLANVRLWDHRPLLDTFSQLQEIRTYYKFNGVDNDRYRLNGDYRQVMLSVRELNHKSLPSRLWINEHLTYTHGYGLVLGPVNEVTTEGLPRLLVRDIPPVSEAGLEVTRPEIYFGEVANEYVIVKTLSKELNYPSGDQNVYSQYEGSGGIPLRHFLRKVAFALRFGTMKILLSRDLTAESRLLFHRSVSERVEQIAPFFLYDSDPYPVLSQGRVFWILDAYTWTNRYPYSQPIKNRLNYIRNSVKAVVDAYNGTVDFYRVDETDPLLQAYDRIFPGLLKPLDQMPADLRSHMRYPRDLFEVQAAMYSRYHMTDAQVFYNQEDLWTSPNEIFQGQEVAVEPYYTLMRLPGTEQKEEYILMLPFTPRQKNNLIAWMAARSDPPHYGQLLAYRFPKDKLVYGPMQIEARIDQDARISQQFTLWSQRGVQVLRGNLMVIPVDNSLLYIEPIYLQAERGKIPELRRIVVAYEERIAMGETLDEALREIFTGWTGRGKTEAGAPSDARTHGLTGRAWALFQRGQEALRQGDWSAYGQSMKELEKVLRQLGEGAKP